MAVGAGVVASAAGAGAASAIVASAVVEYSEKASALEDTVDELGAHMEQLEATINKNRARTIAATNYTAHELANVQDNVTRVAQLAAEAAANQADDPNGLFSF